MTQMNVYYLCYILLECHQVQVRYIDQVWTIDNSYHSIFQSTSQIPSIQEFAQFGILQANTLQNS